jgi:hypothetical protein
LNCLSFDLQLLISLVLSSCFSSYRSCAFRNRSLNVKSCALDYLHLIFDYDWHLHHVRLLCYINTEI